MSGLRTAADAALSVGDYTEATLGAALADVIDGAFRYDNRIAGWRYFESPRWRRDEQGKILRRAQTFLEDRIGFAAIDGEATSTDRSQTIRALTKHLNARSMGNLVKIAGCQPAIALTGAEFDVDPALCGVQNGALELRDEAHFRSGNPRDYLTLACGVPFDKTAECPTWLRFVNQIMQGDAGLIDFLQRAHGSELSGDTSDQVFFVPYGTGSNGKSTEGETIDYVLGDYATSLPFTSIAYARNQESVPSDIARLAGRRRCTFSETRDSVRLDEGRLKALSGGDRLTARELYGRWFDFQPTAKLWLRVNAKPRVSDSSFGFWRRALLVPFVRRFEGAERDDHLKEKLRSEGPGILAWMVEGYRLWRRDGLNPPAGVRSAVESWAAENDLVLQFVADCCTVASGVSTPATALLAALHTWADREHLDRADIPKRNTFYTRLAEHFDKDRDERGVIFRGVVLKALTL